MKRILLDVRSTHPDLEVILSELIQGLAIVLGRDAADTLIWVDDKLVVHDAAKQGS